MMNMMELTIFLLLALSIPSLAVYREYHLVKLLKNWNEAQSYCRENFFDLATIESAEDWTRIKEIMANSGHQDAWMGLYEDVKSWRWTADNTSMYEGGDISSREWFPFKTRIVGNEKICALIRESSAEDRNCKSTGHPVCFDEPSNTYQAPYVYVKGFDMQSYCRQHFTGVVSVKNPQEVEKVLSVVSVRQYAYWLGLSGVGWRWSDQSGSTFKVWGSNQPSGGKETCGSAHASGWKSTSCLVELPFFCSAPRRKVLKIVMKTSRSLNLNDPLVLEAVQKQIEKNMEERGIQQQLRLTWRKKPNGEVFTKPGH